MVSAYIIIDTRKKAKKGFPLKIRIIKNRKVRHLHLKKYTLAEEKKDVDRQLAFFIKKRESKLFEQIEYCNNNNFSLEQSLTFLKSGVIDPDTEIFKLQKKIEQLKIKSKINYLEFFDVRIKEKLDMGQPVRSYKEIKKMLLTYNNDSDINMNDINYEWLNNFIIYKMKKGVSRSGVNSYLATMRAVYKEAQRRKTLNVKEENPFIGLFKPASKKAKNIPNYDIYKTLLDHYNKDKKKYEKKLMKIHLSFFQFLIGGHYLVDVALLKWKDYKDNRLEFKRFKNRHKLNGGEMVSVKVFKTAKAIIKMYGTKKTERIFGFIPDPIKNPTQYRTFQRNINRSYVSYLKETKLNNYNFTSRTPRYIFRTTAGNMQLSDLIIMQIQGHKAHGITYTYQSKIPLQTQDKHHKKIIELVKKYF